MKIIPLAVALGLLAGSAAAQTAIGQFPPRTPPPSSPPAAATPAPGPSARSAAPVSDAVLSQAAEQAEGDFQPMNRPSGGQIQEIWGYSDADAGVTSFRLCGDCVYKVITREFMVTTILLPEDAEIVHHDVGDESAFEVVRRGPNRLAVRPHGYGMDTNLNVYTKAGGVYAFYVRAETFTSKNVPDLVVRLQGNELRSQSLADLAPQLELSTGETDDESVAQVAYRAPDKPAKPLPPIEERAVEGLRTPTPASGDFVRNIPFNADDLHGFDDYELWGDDALRPVMVFRDRQFTYIQFGERWDALELPTAYVVVDDIDELVNTRVQGSTFIIESVAPLISLKSGKQYLCIEYTGQDA